MKKLISILTGAVGVYLFAVSPRLRNRPSPMPKVYYAHRGLHDNQSQAPENTMAAFEKAVKAGYGIELDVQLTKDGHVVVVHDFDLKRICGIEKDVDACTYEQLQEYAVYGSLQKIPLFLDVLKMVDGRVPLIVEIKYKNQKSRICELAQALLDEYKGTYCIESFHPQAVYWYKKHRPQIVRGQLSMNYQKHSTHKGADKWIARHLLLNFLTRPDFIAYDCRSYKAASVMLDRKLFGCPAFGWTVRSQKELEDCLPYFDYFIFEGFMPKE